GVDENNPGEILGRMYGLRIDHATAGCPSLFFVVNDGMNHGMMTDRQVARFQRPGDGCGIAAKISPKRTPSLAQVSILARGTPLAGIVFKISGNMSASSDNHWPVGVMD